MSEQSLATWLWWAQVVGIGAALLTAACTIGQWHFGGRLEQIRSDEARELLKRVQSEIGLPWPPLSESALHELKGVAIDMVPFASTTPPRLRVMFQTEGGQAFAEGIAEAFRRAKWDVECIRGGGFGPGIVVGPGRFGPAVVASLKRVTGTQRVEATNIDIPKMERDYIGIGIHRPDGSDSLAPPPISR